MRYLLFLLLLAGPAWAADYDDLPVLDAPTVVTANLSNMGTYKTIMVENGGSAAVYCSRNPSVTVNNGHKVAATDGWRGFPNDGPLYCIAASSQSGTGRDQLIIWGSYQ